MSKIVEILTYRLRPDSGAAFDAIMLAESAPLHDAAGIDVIAFGPSAHDPQSYMLIRSFASREQMQLVLDDFYASNAWRNGPREAIVASIVENHRITCALNGQTLEALRRDLRRA